MKSLMIRFMTMKNVVKSALLTSVLAPAIALAGDIGGISEQAPVAGGDVKIIDIITTLIGWLTALLIILAVVFIIWAAFIYLTAGGDTEKVGKANKMLIYAAVAIAIALLSQGIVFIVGQLATGGEVEVDQGGLF